MKAKVTVEKDFDHAQVYRKDYQTGDFKVFFEKEGKYLDRLCRIMEEKAEADEMFTVVYTVTVKK